VFPSAELAGNAGEPPAVSTATVKIAFDPVLSTDVIVPKASTALAYGTPIRDVVLAGTVRVLTATGVARAANEFVEINAASIGMTQVATASLDNFVAVFISDEFSWLRLIDD
jgi:hypothetical protein